MKTTVNYGLKKPEGTDVVNIDDFNDNADKIDLEIKSLNDNKQDKVTGKALSTNDYTTAEKNKLAGIAAGAQVNQNAFSNVKVGTTTIAADSATDTLELVAGTNISIVPDDTNDKLTINGTYTYTHPSTHPTSMIVQDTNNRFVSDAEKANWNVKETTSGSQAKANAAEANAKSYTDTKINEVNTELAQTTTILTASGTANAITLDIILQDKKKYSFKAIANSTGAVTINSKPFKKSDGTQIGSDGVKGGRVYDFYYDAATNSVFILAKAEGNAKVGDVLAGKTFSNYDDSGLVGTFTADATATSDDITNGKTAYVNGNKVTGKAPILNYPQENYKIAPGEVITSGDVVEMDNGLVKKCTTKILGQTSALYSPTDYAIDTGEMIWLDSERLLAVYTGASSYGYARIWRIRNNEVVEVGTPTLFRNSSISGNGSFGRRLQVAVVNPDLAIIGYVRSISYIEAVAIAINDMEITAGTFKNIMSGVSSVDTLDIAPINSNKAIMVFEYTGVQSIVLEVDPLTLTINTGTRQVIHSGGVYQVMVEQQGIDKAFLTYITESDPQKGYTRILNISGTNIISGTNVYLSFDGINSTYYKSALVKIAEKRWGMVYYPTAAGGSTGVYLSLGIMVVNNDDTITLLSPPLSFSDTNGVLPDEPLEVCMIDHRTLIVGALKVHASDPTRTYDKSVTIDVAEDNTLTKVNNYLNATALQFFDAMLYMDEGKVLAIRDRVMYIVTNYLAPMGIATSSGNAGQTITVKKFI